MLQVPSHFVRTASDHQLLSEVQALLSLDLTALSAHGANSSLFPEGRTTKPTPARPFKYHRDLTGTASFIPDWHCAGRSTGKRLSLQKAKDSPSEC